MYDLFNETYWKPMWNLTGNENEKLGNSLSLTTDGSRYAIHCRNPRSIEFFNTSAFDEDICR